MRDRFEIGMKDGVFGVEDFTKAVVLAAGLKRLVSSYWTFGEQLAWSLRMIRE